MWRPFLTRRGTDRRRSPTRSTYDEVAQTKLTYGLLTGLAVLALATLATLPLFPFNVACFAALMWLTLRFLEDLTSSVRAALALVRLLLLGKRQLVLLRSMREDLHARVEKLAVERAGLPRDAGVFVKERERRWRRLGLGLGLADAIGERLGYFNPRRRRKKGEFKDLALPTCLFVFSGLATGVYTGTDVSSMLGALITDWNEGASAVSSLRASPLSCLETDLRRASQPSSCLTRRSTRRTSTRRRKRGLGLVLLAAWWRLLTCSSHRVSATNMPMRTA